MKIENEFESDDVISVDESNHRKIWKIVNNLFHCMESIKSLLTDANQSGVEIINCACIFLSPFAHSIPRCE